MGKRRNGVVYVGLLFAGAMYTAAPVRADQTTIERGAYLARAGDCEACHSMPGGKTYAGGVAINSPFGKIYPPNITPDKTAGIGAWSDDEFYRAMHEGVGKNGEYLYPAFPYQWFTKMTRDDVLAIKAYLNTVPPVNVASKETHLMFPFDVRTGLGAWNEAFFKPGEMKVDTSKSPEWNRGAYLVEGPAHCGDCHTTKNFAMAPDPTKAFAGGNIDDWYAPNITSDPTLGIGKWSQDEIVQYLKIGAAPGKGVAVGPMSQVVHDSMAYLTDDDVKDIAVYLKSVPAVADYKPNPSAQGSNAAGPGAIVYLNNCASCHQLDGEGRLGAIPALAGNGVVTAKGPENVIRVIIQGRLATGTYAPMPAVGSNMSDQDILDVTDYVRTAWSNGAPVVDKPGLVGEIRAKTSGGLTGVDAAVKAGDPCAVGDEQPSVPTISDPQHLLDQSLASITDETMWEEIPKLLSRVHALSPNISQADVVNGLSLAFCRIEARDGQLSKTQGRQRLNQFGLMVYSQLTSSGHE